MTEQWPSESVRVGSSRGRRSRRRGSCIGGRTSWTRCVRHAAARPAAALRRRRRARRQGPRRAASSIKIGFVSPRTGPAAGFGEPDPYVIGLAKKAFAKGLDDRRQELLRRRSSTRTASRPRSAARRSRTTCIHSDSVDLMLATSTPETVNPVSDACRGRRRALHLDGGAVGGVVLRPRREARPALAVQVHVPLLLRRASSSPSPTRTCGRRCTTNKSVGVMWPNDADGNAIRAALGPLLEKAGYTIIDPGAYTGRHERLLGADREVQVGATARSSTPSRSRRTSPPSGGRPPSRATSRRSRRSPRPACSRRRSTSLGADRRQPREPALLLDADLPVHLVADRRSAPTSAAATRRRAASSGTSSSARASRCSTSLPRC